MLELSVRPDLDAVDVADEGIGQRGGGEQYGRKGDKWSGHYGRIALSAPK
jgi:hypothetical protein